MEEIEVWKPIRNYEGLYEVSNLGRVKSLSKNIPQRHINGIIRNHIHKERILTPLNNGNGYMYVGLFKDYKSKKMAIHRLVADAFLEKPNECNVVNHKDSNTSNNKASNLEWCNQSYNVKYEYEKNNRKIPTSTKIHQIKDDKIIKTYNSQHDASRETKIAQSGINACLRGIQKTSGGFRWEYVKEEV